MFWPLFFQSLMMILGIVAIGRAIAGFIEQRAGSSDHTSNDGDA